MQRGAVNTTTSCDDGIRDEAAGVPCGAAPTRRDDDVLDGPAGVQRGVISTTLARCDDDDIRARHAGAQRGTIFTTGDA